MSFTSGPFALHAQQVLVEDHAYHPNNTQKLYNSCVKEFIQFCEAKYSSESHAQNASTVTAFYITNLIDLLDQDVRSPLIKKGRKGQHC